MMGLNYFSCDKCLTLVKVLSSDVRRFNELITYHPLWKDGYPCITAGCDGKMERVEKSWSPAIENAMKTNLLRAHSLTLEQFFYALSGFGLPEETKFVPEVVKALLLGCPVQDVEVEESPTGKTVIRSILLVDGLRLHLASSPQGATVFKITRKEDGSPYSLVDRVLQRARGKDVHGTDLRVHRAGERGGSGAEEREAGAGVCEHADGGSNPDHPRGAADPAGVQGADGIGSQGEGSDRPASCDSREEDLRNRARPEDNGPDSE